VIAKDLQMKEPIPDRAEVSMDFPEKAYYGSFTRHSTFDVRSDGEGSHIFLEHRGGEMRRFGFHVHHHLLADLIEALGKSLRACPDLDPEVRRELAAAGKSFSAALTGKASTSGRKKR
jgi:hypothetical protein